VVRRLAFAVAIFQLGMFAIVTGLELMTNDRAGVLSASAQSPSQVVSSSSTDTASIPEVMFPDVSGDWSGTLTDGNKGSGAFSMMIAQTGGKLSGMWSGFFAAGSSPLKGKVSAKGVLHVTLVGEGKCHIVAIATLPNVNHMTANYKYAGCNKELNKDMGSFDVTR